MTDVRRVRKSSDAALLVKPAVSRCQCAGTRQDNLIAKDPPYRPHFPTGHQDILDQTRHHAHVPHVALFYRSTQEPQFHAQRTPIS